MLPVQGHGAAQRPEGTKCSLYPVDVQIMWAAKACSRLSIYSGCVGQPPSLLHAPQYNSHATRARIRYNWREHTTTTAGFAARQLAYCLCARAVRQAAPLSAPPIRTPVSSQRCQAPLPHSKNSSSGMAAGAPLILRQTASQRHPASRHCVPAARSHAAVLHSPLLRYN